MRRPNIKWMIKSVVLVLLTLMLFLLITSWISSSPYTNKPVHHGIEPEALPRVVYRNGDRAKIHLDQPVHRKHADTNEQNPELPEVVYEDVQAEEPAGIPPPAVKEKRKQAAKKREEEQTMQVAAPNEVDDGDGLKKDWHDYKAMASDSKRVGIGEQGVAAKLDEKVKELEEKLSLDNGFNALLSDSISVNRSLPDIRHKACHNKLYLKKLPTVSVVIIFYNEYLSVLMRSVHSLINRSPPELLKEIILVDDFSDRAELYKPLENYIAEHFSFVRVVRLPQRTGLIGARSAGARNATAEVLIFLDSHVEANYNWLPPLLEPIAQNKRTAVCPFIDVIDHSNFNYRAQDEGQRGGFDWEFYYKRLPLTAEDLKHPAEPFKSPVMAGGLFAISTEFFWELGGYDEGLDIWGGEQYELSFKIWMCGGQMFDAPCSRVGHIYRGPRNHVPSPRKGDYLHKNYKRVAEVWMDEYKNYLYANGDGIYEKIDAGDLTAQKAIRTKLQCKSFKWFMEEIAFDLMKVYPPVEPPNYASGAIQNVGDPTLCVDTLSRRRHNKMGVYQCAIDLVKPQKSQYWALSWKRDIRLHRKKDCLDVQLWDKNAPIWLWDCHGQKGNQYWYYDYRKKMIRHGLEGKRCMELLPDTDELVVNTCDPNNKYMKWTFGFVNKTALDNYSQDLDLQLKF
ncbi:N-acetylgalactosaminyltransferase 6 [Drosophila albomicans]|uniref:Polypeptide N-acetylgalactosaminyltransferase n=1 Tax=Drosophila albomicans TaxID=7291 RepID=A0A6P8WQA3_DROAB|nr:N-acetylgalactosaminyltransferase 6 [Drosophila albomicans]XP_034104573.1 N-acetylgalactosaminyltransferase 6 [Drosophila albomicans]